MAKSKSRRRKQRKKGSGEFRSPQLSRAARAESNPPLEKPSRKRRSDDRPPAPWGSFPLQELTVFVGLVILIVGAVQASPQLIVVGVALGALGGLELTVREHLAGYKSHTTLLAGAVFVVVVGGLFYYSGLILLICLGVGAIAFAAAAYYLRGVFQRASGGLSFRV